MWIVGSALFVLAVAFNSYDEIKAEFNAVADQRKAASMLATDAELADWVHQRFYNDMPREQFDKKITSPTPITEPKVIAQLDAIITNPNLSRPLSEWTNDELLAYQLHLAIRPLPNPWLRRGGRLRIRHSASSASSRIIRGVGFLWVRCYTEMNVAMPEGQPGGCGFEHRRLDDLG